MTAPNHGSQSKILAKLGHMRAVWVHHDGTIHQVFNDRLVWWPRVSREKDAGDMSLLDGWPQDLAAGARDR